MGRGTSAGGKRKAGRQTGGWEIFDLGLGPVHRPGILETGRVSLLAGGDSGTEQGNRQGTKGRRGTMGGDGPVGCGWASGGAESPAGQGGPTRQRPVDMDEGPSAGPHRSSMGISCWWPAGLGAVWNSRAALAQGCMRWIGADGDADGAGDGGRRPGYGYGSWARVAGTSPYRTAANGILTASYHCHHRRSATRSALCSRLHRAMTGHLHAYSAANVGILVW